MIDVFYKLRNNMELEISKYKYGYNFFMYQDGVLFASTFCNDYDPQIDKYELFEEDTTIAIINKKMFTDIKKTAEE